MMVRVRDAGEAAAAAVAGIDAVEFGIEGATPDLGGARRVRMAFPGLLRLRFEGMSLDPAIVTAAADAQADEIALALDDPAPTVPVVDAKLPPGLRAVAIVAPTADCLEALQRVRNRVTAVIVDAGGTARLVDRAGIADLDAVASACRASGLAFGLAGALEAPDVARLLLLRPDILAFDTAVRRGHAADGELDPEALAAIRALVPREGSAATPASAIAKVTDRIFVRDFEVALAIGAYRAEHGSRQRVRFGVEADVVRDPSPPRDMRDVFSYDVILETIRVLAERAHVTFVETLAEEVAAALLAHAEIRAVTVKVEKLDVIPGAVGIEIHRRRDAA